MRAINERTTVVGKWEHYKFYLYIPKERNQHNKPYLYFYQNHDNGRERIRIYKGLKRHASVSELKKAGKGIAAEVVEKLKSGWCPLKKYDEQNELGQRSAIQLCLKHWLAYRREVCDYGGMKRKALLSSQYLQTYVTEWLKEKGWLQRPIISFNKYDAELFLRSCAHKRQWGKVSYNTYRCLLGTFFNYLVGLQVLQTNPVRFTKKLNLKHDRSRFKIFEEEELKQVAEALNNDLAFTDLSIAAKLVFFYNIRPSEIIRLQVKDIDFSQNLLTLPASKTKNQNDAVFALRDDLSLPLKEPTNGFNGDWYVFGAKTRSLRIPRSMVTWNSDGKYSERRTSYLHTCGFMR